MPAALLIRLVALWQKEALALLRDRHGLAALFLMPMIFILVMSLALRDAFDVGAANDLGYAIVDLDASPTSQRYVERLQRLLTFRDAGALADEAAARAALHDGAIGFALVIPQGFAAAQPDGPQARGTRPALRLLVDPVVPQALQTAFRLHTEAELGRFQAEALLGRLGRTLMIPELQAIDPAAHALPVQVLGVRAGLPGDNAVLPSSVQQSVPAWLIFSMFFVVIPLSAVFIAERQHGTLQRLASQQLPFALVLAGKLLPFFVVNQIQAVLMVLVGLYLVPLAGGEALVLPRGAAALGALWLVSAAVSVGAVCWALLIASLARTVEQATVIGGVGNILMGALGGIMVPAFFMPGFMQQLAQLSPMAWALDGFHRVLLHNGGIAAVLAPAAALLCFGLAALAAAVLLNLKTRPR
jgi:ABC-2 type transport system permease protein